MDSDRFLAPDLAKAESDGARRRALSTAVAKCRRRALVTPGARPVRSPVGTTLRCRSWQTEGVLRCLMNNLDPEVAERPDDLVVYGGAARAARDWNSFDVIVSELERLGSDKTLLVQSGKPVGVFEHPPDGTQGADRELAPRARLGDLGGVLAARGRRA